MGMYNAIIPDELLHATGVFKERLSQSALFAEMQQVSDAEGAGGAAVAGRQGHEVRHRAERGDRSDRRADSGAVQDVYRGAADRRRFRLRHDRHSVSAGLEGPGAGVGSGRGPAEQCGPAAGEGAQQRARAVRGQRAAALQRSGRVRGPGCAGHQPDLEGAGLRSGNHAARCALRRTVRGERARGVRLGLRDFGRGAAGAPDRAGTRAR